MSKKDETRYLKKEEEEEETRGRPTLWRCTKP